MESAPHLGLYLGLLAAECALTWFIVRRTRKGGGSVRELIGGRWTGPSDVLRDVCIAAAMWGVWTGIGIGWEHLSPSAPSAVVDSMLPHGPIEVVIWIVVSLMAGFAEELAFRGALQRVILRKSSSQFVAVLGQAVAFGVVHGYQGKAAILRITVYGVLFGAAAAWRRSVRPGMIAHAWTDIAAGLFRI